MRSHSHLWMVQTYRQQRQQQQLLRQAHDRRRRRCVGEYKSTNFSTSRGRKRKKTTSALSCTVRVDRKRECSLARLSVCLSDSSGFHVLRERASESESWLEKVSEIVIYSFKLDNEPQLASSWEGEIVGVISGLCMNCVSASKSYLRACVQTVYSYEWSEYPLCLTVS